MDSSSRQSVIAAVAITAIVTSSVFILWNLKSRRHQASDGSIYATNAEIIANEIIKSVGKGGTVAIIGC